jgi:hypothetical protein
MVRLSFAVLIVVACSLSMPEFASAQFPGSGWRPGRVLSIASGRLQSSSGSSLAEVGRLARGGVDGYLASGGHPGGAFGHRFVGTGYSSNHNNIQTCEPPFGSRLRLTSDVVRRGVDGKWFRVRTWD